MRIGPISFPSSLPIPHILFATFHKSRLSSVPVYNNYVSMVLKESFDDIEFEPVGKKPCNWCIYACVV